MTGTPKEEASRLFAKFYNLIPQLFLHYGDHKKLAKELALACVQEILEDAEANWNVDDKNYEHSGHAKFWLEVKLELLQK
jgi:hypothetical protein